MGNPYVYQAASLVLWDEVEGKVIDITVDRSRMGARCGQAVISCMLQEYYPET